MLSSLVHVDHLSKKGPPAFPFIVMFTVDTEAGFCRTDTECVWADTAPRALQGYSYGAAHLLQLSKDLGVPFTYFLSVQCFVAEQRLKKKIKWTLRQIIEEGSEIGLHLHPRTDEPLHVAVNRKLPYASAHQYSAAEQLEMLLASRIIIRKELGSKVDESMLSFRWGNWGLSTASVGALESAGFRVDSSAMPLKIGNVGTDRFYDWSRMKTHDAFFLSRHDYQDYTSGGSTVLELPVATFRLFGQRNADVLWGDVLASVFSHYYVHADRSAKPFIFVVATHSPEMTREDGTATSSVHHARSFLEYARGFSDVRFMTATSAAASLGLQQTPAVAQAQHSASMMQIH